MGLATVASGGLTLANHQHASQESFENRFELVRAAGMGFFGAVFYARVKSDYLLQTSRLTNNSVSYDTGDGIQGTIAVKICNPFCPSGVRTSARHLVKEIKAMQQIWSIMNEPLEHHFAKLYEYNTSDAPWYSMEPVLSGLTLESLFLTTQAKQQPIPEHLMFHMVDQITKAYIFLYEECRIVRADANRRNIMLRYPGRETPLMPDLVLIDWSLWEEASEERIIKDTKDVLESLSPVLFEGGRSCGASHEQVACTVSSTAHSRDWLQLYDIMSKRKCSMQSLRRKVSTTAEESRKKVDVGSEAAGAIQDLLATAGDSFMESSLREVVA